MQRSKRLLVVDDDPGFTERLRRTLTRWSVVDTARNADEALLLLGASRYDAVLCGEKLGDHDGIWLLKRVRVRHPDVLRVLASRRSPQAIWAEPPTVVQRHLPKPVALEELLRLLDIAAGPRYVGARI